MISTNIFHTLLIMYKARSQKLPKIFDTLFTELNHKYPTRFSKDAFQLLNLSLKQSDFKISIRGPALWNSFKNTIENPFELSLGKFKHESKVKLLSLEN